MALASPTQLSIASLLVGLATIYVVTRCFHHRRLRYPPGPRGVPILGNLFDVPTDDAWVRYQQVGRECGSEIIHFQVLSMHIVVVNSIKVAHELFEKRSSIHSSRQRSVMLSELSGWIRNWAFWQYGDGWRKHRRFITQNFRPEVVPGYHTRQVKGVHDLLQSLLDDPEEFREHIEFMAASTLLDVVYGLEVRRGDPVVELAQQAVDTLTEFLNIGIFLVDVIPWLKVLPSWLPGVDFKRRAARWKKVVDGMYDVPYRIYQAALRERHIKPCFTSVLLTAAEEGEGWEDLDEAVINVAGTTLGAGEDTTKTTLDAFILALTLFPEAQVAAPEEIDRVLGRKRLVILQDQPASPQVTAMVLELLRWHTVLPLAAPHMSVADDEYEGYFIPAGSIVIGNSWAMLHDPSVFPDPERFDPSRFVTADGALRDDVPSITPAFGFGRRVCPGRHFARDFVWLAIANILAVFSVGRAVDDDGHEVNTRPEFSSRFFRTPLPFRCSIESRYPEAESLIRTAIESE
ncbi:cytochrome P450 [Phanerochaete sordida]|uniref:Cytochrome P450 n=1 Tax=Phanerochaete sordida TaxID=48140 RepID=A0A9P3GJ39_9APHY|nr:cytochrome P450 [Phanerochaete sordida]